MPTQSLGPRIESGVKTQKNPFPFGKWTKVTVLVEDTLYKVNCNIRINDSVLHVCGRCNMVTNELMLVNISSIESESGGSIVITDPSKKEAFFSLVRRKLIEQLDFCTPLLIAKSCICKKETSENDDYIPEFGQNLHS